MTSRKSVCVVTSTRADYGILKPLIQALYNHNQIDLFLTVTAAHLSPLFGMTYKEIENDGFKIHKKIETLSGDEDMSECMGLTVTRFSDYFAEYKPDLVIVLGDRYEIVSVCCAAVNNRIPVAHLHGGESTEGLIDEYYRHAITKMSILHFVSCEQYRKRVIQLGEHPDRVFNVGALGVENILRTKLLDLNVLEKVINFKLSDKPYAIVTFHPVTLEENTAEFQLKELLSAIEDFPEMRFIITKSNADAGGSVINHLLDKFGETHDNCLVVYSLGMLKYLSALKYARVVIGNSSSGILEAPSMKVPTVNIGDRQKGRIQAKSIINCLPLRENITKAIRQSLSEEFKNVADSSKNVYGDGNTSDKIINILSEFLFNDKLLLEKNFYNLDFDV
jgi:GDP/UDP-N,N'-diacetylbacillosamine 2-epimerase (hydrolysing)